LGDDPVKDTQRLDTLRLPDDTAGRDAAAQILRDGGLVAFATETVYGLGADATSPAAVARIYAAKARPAFNPLIAHVPSLDAAMREGMFDETARALAQAFWPGPLTLVLPLAAGASVCDLARAGLSTIALRVPAHAGAREMIAAVGRPVAAPSANRSGHLSPIDADHVLADLGGRIDAVLDAGRTIVGIESTVASCLGGQPALLRPGGVATQDIIALVGPLAAPGGDRVTSPGMLASHYAPRAPLRLGALALEEGEAGLDFAARFGGRTLDLSPAGDMMEAAANLYAFLRRLDAARPRRIAVAPIPIRGLGEAINDRLRRAAAPRTNRG
jgi:L-threonylcarbamoyladenylate synthase